MLAKQIKLVYIIHKLNKNRFKQNYIKMNKKRIDYSRFNHGIFIIFIYRNKNLLNLKF
jgi:hypothetical protein